MEEKAVPSDIKSFNEFMSTLPDYEKYLKSIPQTLTEKRLELITNIYHQALLDLPYFKSSPNFENAIIISMLKARNIVYGVKYSTRVETMLKRYDESIEEMLEQ